MVNDFPLDIYNEEGIQVVGKALPTRRGDDFDIGSPNQEPGHSSAPGEIHITEVISNQNSILQAFGLSGAQADNVIALITAGGAGAATKYLSKIFGPEIAGMIGAGLAAYLGKKIVKGTNATKQY